MDTPESIPGAETISKYLTLGNDRIKKIVGMVAYNVTAAARQAAQVLISDRERVSDATDHLDGEFISELSMEQAEEIKEINKIGHELQHYFDNTIMKLAFKNYGKEVQAQLQDLENREKSFLKREQDFEQAVEDRIAQVRVDIARETDRARSYFETALAKSERVFDQNKMTRFAYATISIFQEEFHQIEGSNDVARITDLYERVIEPFQVTKMVMDHEGELKKVTTNPFSEECCQDLYVFFYKYYNELLDVYRNSGELPSTADELTRIFQKPKKDVKEIIADMAAPVKLKKVS
jgi:hypothetical protein